MLELFSGSLIYSLLKDAWAAVRGRKRRLSPEQVLDLRQKWKKEIDPSSGRALRRSFAWTSSSAT
jgi:hypothetical protein